MALEPGRPRAPSLPDRIDSRWLPTGTPNRHSVERNPGRPYGVDRVVVVVGQSQPGTTNPNRGYGGARRAAALMVAGIVFAACLSAPRAAGGRPFAETDTAPTASAGPPVSVQVDAAALLGPSAVGDFLGGLGVFPSSHVSADDPVVRAWNDAGMRNLRGLGGTWAIEVRRGKNGRLRYDFAIFDADESAALNLFNVEVSNDSLDVAIWGTPRPLSSMPRAKQYAEYAPARWAQWNAYMRRVARHVVNRWGITGARYELWTHPEDGKYLWKGRPGDDDQQRLARYVKLYIATHRALTSVDPAAELLAPASAAANLAAFGAPWGLAEFVQSVKAFNDAHPDKTVPIHNLAWHEFGWSASEEGFGSGQDFSVGIDFIDSVVATIGVPSPTFPEWPRYYITEYSDGIEPAPNLRRAAYAARNMIRELAPTTRRLAHIHLYAFYGFGSVAAYALRPDGSECRRPLFAVLEMMNAMTSGDYAATFASEPLAAMATVDGTNRVTVTVNNYSPQQVDAELVVTNLPFTSETLVQNVRQVDNAHSNDCLGLEQGATEQFGPQQGTATTSLTLTPYATVQLTLTP
jgi:hypothetical protein